MTDGSTRALFFYPQHPFTQRGGTSSAAQVVFTLECTLMKTRPALQFKQPYHGLFDSSVDNGVLIVKNTLCCITAGNSTVSNFHRVKEMAKLNAHFVSFGLEVTYNITANYYDFSEVSTHLIPRWKKHLTFNLVFTHKSCISRWYVELNNVCHVWTGTHYMLTQSWH